MNTIIEQFLIESRELIERATDELLQLERRPDDAELVDSLFRAFHTLKGSADIVGLPEMSLALHAGEDVLSALRSQALVCTPVIADAALALLGQTGAWLDALERSDKLPSDAGAVATRLAATLRDAFAGGEGRGDQASAPMPKWVETLLTDRSIAERVRHASLQAVGYDPLPQAFFNGDDPLDFVRRLPGLVALDVQCREPWPGIAELDPFACNLSIRALVEGAPSDIAGHFRFIADQVTITPVVPPGPATPQHLTQAILEEQLRLLSIPAAPEAMAGRIGASTRAAANTLRHAGQGDTAEDVEAASARALETGDMDGLIAAISRAMTPVEPEKPVAEARPADRVLRIEAAKIDALADLTGELVIAKNSFGHLIGRAEAGLDLPELIRTLRVQHASLERLTAMLHASVMQVRLLPMAQMFRRFPRLVRDIAQELGKEIDFVTGGEDTEADKDVIEKLYEPLLHVVRNALDHGCETPRERRALSKPPRATLALRAFRDGDGVLVEVADDGRGIDADAVRRAAVGRGLMTREAADALAAEEAIQLVFLPGFSTATSVSTLSGRGVGMDAVRAAIERVGGRVTLASTPGQGTTVRMALPLSLVMTRIMTVRIDGENFGVPLDQVIETARLPRDRVVPIRTGFAAVLRDRTVPVVSLREILGFPGAETPEAHLLIASTEAGIMGIEVDGFAERFDAVMKPLDGLLANMPNVLGTTLTGEGRVLLVLDLNGAVR